VSYGNVAITFKKRINMTMKKIICAALIIGGVACNNNDDQNNTIVSQMDRDFVSQASITNTSEIQAGQLALTKATDTAIRSFAQMMVTEHTDAQNDLKSLDSVVNMTITDSVDAEHAALMAQLAVLTGSAFDSAYINSQVTGHAEAIDLFNNEINNGSNDEVQNYANTYLPHIQMHYTLADSLAMNY
jgi:putative membrane protein